MQKVILPTNFTKTIFIAPAIASLVFKSDLEKTPDINKLKIRFVNIFYHIQQQNIFSTFTPQVWIYSVLCSNNNCFETAKYITVGHVSV